MQEVGVEGICVPVFRGQKDVCRRNEQYLNARSTSFPENPYYRVMVDGEELT